MINLQTLNCFETVVESLEPLCHLVNLRELRCFKTRIESLEPLRNLTNLEILSCDHTAVKSLEPLRNLTNLQVLSCVGTRISPDEIKRFQEEHPYCWVRVRDEEEDRWDEDAGGGWEPWELGLTAYPHSTHAGDEDDWDEKDENDH